MRAKILLVVPPFQGNYRDDLITAAEPLGLLYLASTLENNGYEVRILDAHAFGIQQVQKVNSQLRVGLSDDQIVDYLKDYQPDIIGISSSFTAYEHCVFTVARICRQTCPHALILCGGAHASANPDSVLLCKDVDVIVRGEGELTMLEIVERYNKQASIDEVKGTSMRVDGEIRHNPPREPIADLDTISFPARHLIHWQGKSYPDVYQIAHGPQYSMRRPIAAIITSRGCPNQCVFCSSFTIWGRKWRPRSASNVLEEMSLLRQQYGIREFYVYDDFVALDKDRLMEICNGMIERRLDVKWVTPSGLAIWRVDRELLATMKKSGYYRALFAIESGSPKTLKFIGKPVELGHVKEVIKICHELGLWVYSNFIIGFPGEDAESIEETKRFILESNLDHIALFVAQPLAGTRLYKIFEEKGLFKNGEPMDSSSQLHSKYDSDYFTAGQLNEKRGEIMDEFDRQRIRRYLNPIVFCRQLLPKINSPEKFFYFLTVALYRPKAERVKLEI